MSSWIVTIAALITSVLKAAQTWLKWNISQQERTSGRTEERLKNTEAARKVEHEMAKVEANPSDADAVAKRLSDGKF